MRNSIKLWDTNDEDSIFIINDDVILVSSLYRDSMLLDISKEGLISKILKSEKMSGYFEYYVSGKKSFITYEDIIAKLKEQIVDSRSDVDKLLNE